tara:strand:- start:90 stop:287 length:198 start_codon:yes stop_codon:yes gene_type:complete
MRLELSESEIIEAITDYCDARWLGEIDPWGEGVEISAKTDGETTARLRIGTMRGPVITLSVEVEA